MADEGDVVEVTSSIIMKIDAPPEDNDFNPEESKVDDKLEDSSINSSPLCTVVNQKPSLVCASNFGSPNPFSMKPSVLSSPKLGSGLILRPSQLEKKAEVAKNSFSLQPSRLNPFTKASTSENDESKTESSNGDTGVKFVPLVTSESSKTSRSPTSTSQSSSSVATTASPAANFVFGQNLHERVIAESENASEVHSSDGEASASCSNSNGSSELLFSTAVKKDAQETQHKESSKSLTESAREYEESRANKRKYVEVEVITGEEGESNVLQVQCKLFAFDKAGGTWQERGRGVLRLNDKSIELDGKGSYTQSRLVVRSSGNLRVVLNTKIWADMVLEKASARSIRLTALDGNGEIKVFLIMANPEEIKHLHKNLELRLNKEIERQKQMAECSPNKVIKGANEN